MIFLIFFILFSLEEKNPAILYLNSQQALDKGDYKKSIEYLKKATNLDDSPFLKIELAKTLSYEENFEEALKILESFSPPKSLVENYYSLKFYLHLMLHDIEKALDSYEKIKNFMLSKENINLLAEAIQKNILKYLSEESPSNSIKLLQILFNYFPKDVPVQEALINLYLEEGNLEGIKNILSKIEINKDTYPLILNVLSYFAQKEDCSSILSLKLDFKEMEEEELLLILSYCFLKSGEAEKAEETLKKILSINPDNFEVFLYLIEIKIINGDYREAEELIKAAPREKEEQVNFLREFEGILFQMKGEYKKAEEIFLKLLQKFESKERIKILKKIYNFYKRIGDCYKTLEYAYKLQEEEPEDNPAILRIAEGYLLLKDIEMASFFLNIYIERGERSAIIDAIWLLLDYNFLKEASFFIKEIENIEIEQKNLVLGFYYYKIGDLLKMEEVLKRDQKNPYSLNLLGYLLIEKDQKIDEAIRYIEKALELEPFNGSFLDSLGWGYFKKGEWEKAYEYLKKAILLEPYNGIILSHLGDVCEKLGKYEEAFLRYRQALSSQVPDMPDVLKKIKEILKNFNFKF